MYTNDDRFHVLHADNADNWDLHIKYVQKRDAGSYECQVCNILNSQTEILIKIEKINSAKPDNSTFFI